MAGLDVLSSSALELRYTVSWLQLEVVSRDRLHAAVVEEDQYVRSSKR